MIETTAGSSGSTPRETVAWTALTMWLAATMGSRVRCGVAAGSLDEDRKGLGRGHRSAAHDSEFADRHSRPVVDRIGALHGKALEHAVIDHRLRAGAAFFRRLEAEDERSIERPGLREMAGRPEQHRRVAVMSAGVHASGRGGGVFGAARLRDRQSVHVGADENAPVRARRRALGAVQDAENAGLADAFDNLVEPEGAEPLGDQARGARQIVGQLGMTMEIAPPFGQLRDQGGDGVLQRDVHLLRLQFKAGQKIGEAMGLLRRQRCGLP